MGAVQKKQVHLAIYTEVDPDDCMTTAERDKWLDTHRPRTRADCVDGPRPCPWVSCRHHLYLDVSRAGTLKINKPEQMPWDMGKSCALDIADMGGVTLEEIGDVFGLVRERIRQIEDRLLKAIRRMDIDWEQPPAARR